MRSSSPPPPNCTRPIGRRYCSSICTAQECSTRSRPCAGTVVGFASHVDDSLLQAARDAGCAEVLPRSRFFRRLTELGRDTGQTGRRMNRLIENDQKLLSGALHGRAWCESYSAKVDEWLTMLWTDVAGDRRDVALVATGGHGRRELSPYSDLDLLLLHGGSNVEELAKSLWYPMWDIGVKLGHAVRTVDEALSLARDDLDVADLAACRRRCVAGSAELAQDLHDRATHAVAQRVTPGARRAARTGRRSPSEERRGRVLCSSPI